jgi:mannose-6-phosphate isomerase-like protein (cupin superfamily)
MIKNFLKTDKQKRTNSHDGEGPYDLYEIWAGDDFKSKTEFIDRMVVKPGSVVGYHKHGNNEEMYIILEGQGTMTIDGQSRRVAKGDMILNPPGGQHGLVNDSDADIDILVIQISL